MLVFGRGRFRPHVLWAIGVLAATAAASAWYAVESTKRGEWLGGSSLVGLVLGIVGALLILFEMALWPRKRMRARRFLGRAQAWMRAHIWLGLMTVPLVLLHSGFRLGSPLTTLLVVVFAVVIVSGIWGLAMQHWLPTKMFKEIPLETINTQIEHVGQQMTEEAQKLVIRLSGGAGDALDRTQASSESVVFLGAKSLPSWSVSARSLDTITSLQDVSEGTRLVNFYVEEIHPYLTTGRASRSALADPAYARRAFEQLRGRLEPAAHPAVDRLIALCEERRQFDHQRALQRWLHNWLLVHLPLSVALIFLLILHIWVAWRYW